MLAGSCHALFNALLFDFVLCCLLQMSDGMPRSYLDHIPPPTTTTAPAGSHEIPHHTNPHHPYAYEPHAMYNQFEEFREG